MTNDEYTPDVELDETEINEEELDNQELQDQSEDTENTEDETDWKAEALKYKAILERNKGKDKQKETSKKSDELDYGMKAFLVANGLKGNDEFKLAQEFSKNTGKALDDIFESKYFRQELEDFREIKNTQNATIKGKGKSSNVAQNDIEYWLAKPFGELPDDFELRKKVVQARRTKSRNTGMFTKD